MARERFRASFSESRAASCSLRARSMSARLTRPMTMWCSFPCARNAASACDTWSWASFSRPNRPRALPMFPVADAMPFSWFSLRKMARACRCNSRARSRSFRRSCTLPSPSSTSASRSVSLASRATSRASRNTRCAAPYSPRRRRISPRLSSAQESCFGSLASLNTRIACRRCSPAGPNSPSSESVLPTYVSAMPVPTLSSRPWWIESMRRHAVSMPSLSSARRAWKPAARYAVAAMRNQPTCSACMPAAT